ncbi:MAG: EamA family transporter [Candidatus Micrarchaeota archaeon]|nr:EamA family transporter [Candidatus Micrarchaeota archaeon]
MDIKLKAQVFVAITIVTGSLIPILVEAANTTNMYGFFMLTAFISAITGFAFMFATNRTEKLVDVVRDRRMLALAVLIGLLVFLPIEFGIAYAEKFVSASLATVLFRTSPLLMLPLLPLLLREKLTKYQVTALGLAFVGIYVGATGGTLTSVFLNANLFAVVLLIAIAFIYALSTVLIKKYIIDMGALLTIAAVALSALFAALYLASGAGAISLGMPVVLSILFLGVGSNFVFYYMYFVGLRILKTTFVTNLISLSPFLTFLFANVFLGEQIAPYYIAIAVLVGIGIIVQHLDKVGGTYLARKSHGIRNFVIFDVSGAFANTGEVAISNALKSGARVMAVKLPARHKKNIARRVAEGGHANVFTSEHRSIVDEANFVRDITGAGREDMVLMKVGSFDEGEAFFSGMSDLISEEPLERKVA